MNAVGVLHYGQQTVSAALDGVSADRWETAECGADSAGWLMIILKYSQVLHAFPAPRGHPDDHDR